MVYESGFTTRRTYTSRPIISSYAVSYPVEHKVSRVYKMTYPIYSSYTVPRRVYTGARIYTSPVRVITSPARVVTRVIHSPSPIRVVRTTTRVISSPERTMSYTYTTPKIYNSSYLPATIYSSYLPSTYVYSTPSYYYSPMSRVFTRSLSPPIRITTSPVRSTTSYLKRTLPGYGARALTNYLNTEPFAAFQDETNRIRHRAQSLIRDIHSPVVRRSRSCTPFPVTGYTYEPTSKLALDAYVERITNPVRHVAKEVHRISHYPEPAKKYVGKSHLASMRICGDKAYNIRRPMYDSDKVRTDINLLSWYLRNSHGKGDEKSKENYSEKAVDAVEVDA
ncbi:PREDICTED: protein anoxia up-regulated-like isoform X8 [Bactrocera latifrons]|uniref:Protein anoxia up-regulated n=1 Tax=Bactrocera latifrons TaxID=174628 RepID=A0A0K8VYK8_BACLA|nr:PREDICTED: protein anoxia up-regulated-like isoform X8 [Bactrocera latifrons]